MPTIIDPNLSTNSQLKDLAATVALTKQVTPKFFHTCLTGSGSRLSGFFSKTNDIVHEFIANNGAKLADSAVFLTPNQISTDSSRETTYLKENQAHKKDFVRFAVIPTMGILPRDIQAHLGILRTNQLEIRVPANTYLFDILQSKTGWAAVKTTGDLVTAVQLHVESLTMYEKQIDSTKANTKKETIIAGAPVLYASIMQYHKDMDINAAEVVITNDKKAHNVSPDQAVMSIINVPIRDFINKNGAHEYSAHPYATYTPKINKHNLKVLNDYDISDYTEISDMFNALTDMSMSQRLTDQASAIALHFEEQALSYIKGLLSFGQNQPSHKDEIARAIGRTVHMFDNIAELDQDAITTTFLDQIYTELHNHKSWLTEQNINMIVKQSLRLLLSQRLHQLEVLNQNNQLYAAKAIDPAVKTAFAANPAYSKQQKRIILTDEPLVIGQAGAGSGKSHTLIGRIQYLKQNNEDLRKALVLSFTNVAALNITNRFPEIRSETLANMFNTIYHRTYPLQQLSQPSTVANSIQLLNPDSPIFSNKGYNKDATDKFLRSFAQCIKSFDQSGYSKIDLPSVTKALSNLIENNLELTSIVLDAVEQTTLELQPIIIHHHLLKNNNTLNIPQEYQELNYIITDESQDISTFEYILLLELTIHYHSQLLIIGDGSQTLYEFRNSDPRYMNALEASGVFTAYKLDVNYRSRQEILLYANQFLDVIEANDYAHIQLTSNNFRKPTIDSFKQAVQVNDLLLSDGKPMVYAEELEEYMTDDQQFLSWVLPKLQNGEQVAILGWTRAEVTAAGKAIEKILADNQLNIDITNIMSDNQRPTTVISDTIVVAKNDLYTIPVSYNFIKDLKQKLDAAAKARYKHASDKQLAFFQSIIRQAVDEVGNQPIWRSLMKDAIAKKVSAAQLIGHMTRELLRIETRKNATEQYLRKTKDVPDYDNSKIILSTIHGAKGLEFKHTIVLFNEAKKNSRSQESLRMMFVALSRAKESEYIINAIVQRASTNQRVITSNQSSMFITPMPTAYLRTLDVIDKQNAPQPIIGSNSDDE